MTSMPKSLSVFYFFAGLVVGLFIGLSINREWATVVTKLIGAGAILVIAFFWRRIESYAHKRYLETWSVRRLRGKWHFILTHYIFIRGALILAAVVGPVFPMLVFTNETLLTICVSLVAFAALMTYLGHESWTECEQDYEVQVLRQAAEQSRIARN
jgi:hypothetical protein